jgi:catechol 2,3-dioxygenase-like lactoylglutathione lyase family enzyme
MNLERISAITIKVSDMAKSVHFYNKLLGLKILHGGEKTIFFFPSDARRERCNSEP